MKMLKTLAAYSLPLLLIGCTAQNSPEPQRNYSAPPLELSDQSLYETQTVPQTTISLDNCLLYPKKSYHRAAVGVHGGTFVVQGEAVGAGCGGTTQFEFTDKMRKRTYENDFWEPFTGLTIQNQNGNKFTMIIYGKGEPNTTLENNVLKIKCANSCFGAAYYPAAR